MSKKRKKKKQISKQSEPEQRHKRLTLGNLLKSSPEYFTNMDYETVLRYILHVKNLTHRYLFNQICSKQTKRTAFETLLALIVLKLKHEDAGKREPGWFKKEAAKPTEVIVEHREPLFGIFWRSPKVTGRVEKSLHKSQTP